MLPKKYICKVTGNTGVPGLYAHCSCLVKLTQKIVKNFHCWLYETRPGYIASFSGFWRQLFGKVLGNFDRWKKNYSRSLRPMLHTPKILMTLELQSVYKKPETKFIKKGGIFILSFFGLFIWASIKFYNKSKIFSILFLSFPCPKNIVQKWSEHTNKYSLLIFFLNVTDCNCSK